MKFKLIDKKTGEVNSYEMAKSWFDITVKQFFELREWDGLDKLKLLCVLSNCDYQTFCNADANQLDDKLWAHTAFLEQPIDKDPYKAEGINIAGKYYVVPKELNKGYQFVMAQKEAMRSRMVKDLNEKKDAIYSAPFIVACYYYPIVKGLKFSPDGLHFDRDEAQKFAEEELASCKMIEVLSVYNFFLPKLVGSQIARQPSLILNQVKNKWLRKLISWMFSKRLTRLTPLQEVIF